MLALTSLVQRVTVVMTVNPDLLRNTSTPGRTRDILQLVVGDQGGWSPVIVREEVDHCGFDRGVERFIGGE